MMTLLVVGFGAGLLLALNAAIARRNAGAAQPVPSFVSVKAKPVEGPIPAAIQEWEAMLLTASTGGARGRARLARRLQPLVTSRLRANHGLSIETPEATTILGPEWVFLTGRPSTMDGKHGSTEAVLEAVDQLLDRLEETGWKKHE